MYAQTSQQCVVVSFNTYCMNAREIKILLIFSYSVVEHISGQLKFSQFGIATMALALHLHGRLSIRLLTSLNATVNFLYDAFR